MTLNNNQLATIGVYVSQDCKYPDLQVEIAEHIKYRIQDMMTADGRLQLEDAYIMVRMEFGDNNFNIFEQSKKAALRNKYRNLFLKSLMAELHIKYVAACATVALWIYLFYTEVRLPESQGIWWGLSGYWFCFLGFAPIYMILFSMKFNPAKRYKMYYIWGISNEVLFKWNSIGSFATVLCFATHILAQEGKFALASVIGAIAATMSVILFRAGYAVRQTAIADCREAALNYNITLV